jgi:hypothetical protein
MQDIKVCKNCKYWSYESSLNVCKHSLSQIQQREINLITGSVIKESYRECSNMRFYTNCGEEGDLFEEREDLVYKVIKFFKRK